jgi:hypothetical protein
MGTVYVYSRTNRNPITGIDSVTAPPGTLVSVNVLANDSDPDGDTLTLASVTTCCGFPTWDASGVIQTYSSSILGDVLLLDYIVTDAYGGTAMGTLYVYSQAASTPSPAPTSTPFLPTPSPFPPPEIVAYLPGGPVYMSIPDALRGAVSYRQLVGGRLAPWDVALGGARVGVEWLAPITLNAVDVTWPPLQVTHLPVMVCLQGTGRVFVLAASGQPRTPVEMTPFTPDDAPGYACVMLTAPATVVLTR